MGITLYVTNLSHAATAERLRAHFDRCGPVSDVRLLADRQGLGAAPTAMVTMATRSGADLALERLNHGAFDGRPLVIGAMPDRNDGRDDHGRGDNGREDGQGSRRQKAVAPKPNATVTQQYRERSNMTYELDCVGESLIMRVFFPALSGPELWRIEARGSASGDSVVMEQTAATRALALGALAEAWQAAGLQSLDWPAITHAMKSVRAI